MELTFLPLSAFATFRFGLEALLPCKRKDEAHLPAPILDPGFPEKHDASRFDTLARFYENWKWKSYAL